METPTPQQQLTEAVDIMAQAQLELKRLRETNQHQHARLKMFDDVMMLLKMEPQRNGCCDNMHDSVYRIEKFIASTKMPQVEPPKK